MYLRQNIANLCFQKFQKQSQNASLSPPLVDAKKERKNNSCSICAKNLQNRFSLDRNRLVLIFKKEVRWLIEINDLIFRGKTMIILLLSKHCSKKLSRANRFQFSSLKHSFFVIKDRKGCQAQSHIYSVLQDKFATKFLIPYKFLQTMNLYARSARRKLITCNLM